MTCFHIQVLRHCLQQALLETHQLSSVFELTNLSNHDVILIYTIIILLEKLIPYANNSRFISPSMIIPTSSNILYPSVALAIHSYRKRTTLSLSDCNFAKPKVYVYGNTTKNITISWDWKHHHLTRLLIKPLFNEHANNIINKIIIITEA